MKFTVSTQLALGNQLQQPTRHHMALTGNGPQSNQWWESCPQAEDSYDLYAGQHSARLNDGDSLRQIIGTTECGSERPNFR